MSEKPSAKSGDRSPSRSFTWLAALLSVLLLGSFLGAAIQFARHASPTYDEVCHLPAGYSYVQWNDYRMNPEHPPLVKKIAALPLLGQSVWPDSPALRPEDLLAGPRDSGMTLRTAWTVRLEQMRNEWIFGHQFLYGVRPEKFRELTAHEPALKDPFQISTRTELKPADFANDADALVFRARLAVLGFGVALALVIFLWARALAGIAGGVLALALFCCDPNFIAHSALVTTDVAASLAFCLTMFCWWRLLCAEERAGGTVWPARLSFALSLGLAFTVKFSVLLLLPMLGATGFAWWWLKVRLTPRCWSWWRSVCLTMLVAGFTTWVCIWTVYSFRYAAVADVGKQVAAENALHLPATFREPGHLPLELVLRKGSARRFLGATNPSALADPARVDEEVAAVKLGWRARLILAIDRAHLLPEAYTYGFASSMAGAQARPSYLNGEISPVGFRGYFFWTALYKTPLPTLLLIGGAVVSGLLVWRRQLAAHAFLLIPALAYLAVSLMANLNIGHRHLLPVLPFLYVLAGGFAQPWSTWSPRKRLLSAVVVLGLLFTSSRVVFAPQPQLPWRPAHWFQLVGSHQLAYFNELAGGPFNGHKLLADSNVDWGQELKHIKPLLAAHGVTEPVALVYFGMADPRHEGFPHDCPPGGYPLCDWTQFKDLQGGQLIVMSATAQTGQFMAAADREIWRRLPVRLTLLDHLGGAILIYRYNGE